MKNIKNDKEFKAFKEKKVYELKIVKEKACRAAERKRILDLNRPSLLKIFYTCTKIVAAAVGILITSPLILLTGITGGAIGLSITSVVDRQYGILGGLIGMALGAQVGSLGSLWMFSANILELKELIQKRGNPLK